MRLHRLLSAVGVAVVAFGVVAVVVIEAFGSTADVGAGILGVVAGAIAAIVAFVVVTIYVEGLAGIARWAVDAVAVGGLTLVAVGAVVYVDVVSLETTTALAIAAFAAIVAFAGGWLGESRGRTSQ
jgi:hypothetical protein